MVTVTQKSQASIASSKRSGPSYRKVSNRSQIDQTLFANPQKSPDRPAQISSDQLQQLKSKVLGGIVPENVSVIPKSQIQRMTAAAVLKSKEQVQAEHKLFQQQKQQQKAAAIARKQRMQALEAQRQRNQPLNQADRENQQRRTHFKQRAHKLAQEQHDDVKQMNTRVLYSKVATVRDQQLIEKKLITEKEKEQDVRLDLMMEIQRLKVIKYHDEREQQWKEDRKQGALVLQDQIRDREYQRMKEQELLQKERLQMLRQIEQMQQEQYQQTLEKKQMQKKLLAEVEQSNNKAILIKEERKKLEKIQDERIMEYNLQKAKKEQEAVEEQERIQAEKEREVQRLRERQEKAQDRQADLDALRAKRASEAQERVEREKQRKEAEKKARINRELEQARQTQAREKEIRMMIQAKMERDQFERVIQVQKQEAEAEKRLEEANVQVRKQHAQQLKAQILTNDEQRQQERREYLEEGRKLSKEINDEREILEKIKREKLDGLFTEGVPGKYTTDLARKKISIQQ